MEPLIKSVYLPGIQAIVKWYPSMTLATQKLKLGTVPKATLECCLSRGHSDFAVLQPAPATSKDLKTQEDSL